MVLHFGNGIPVGKGVRVLENWQRLQWSTVQAFRLVGYFVVL